jgi:hypothetical protein
MSSRDRELAEIYWMLDDAISDLEKKVGRRELRRLREAVDWLKAWVASALPPERHPTETDGDA